MLRIQRVGQVAAALLVWLGGGVGLRGEAPPGRGSACGASRAAVHEPALSERVGLWWRARQEREHDALYQLYEEQYRAETPYAKFLSESTMRHRFDVISHCVRSVQLEAEDHAQAWIEFEFLHPTLGKLRSRMREEWVREGGQWFKRYRPPQLPFPKGVDISSDTERRQ